MKRSFGLLHAAALGLLLAVGGVAALACFGRRSSPEYSMEETLWVCDWEVTTIYGPGSPEQANLVMQLRQTSLHDKRFATPFLYRMGPGLARSAREGLVMIPFDPHHPESALALKAER